MTLFPSVLTVAAVRRVALPAARPARVDRRSTCGIHDWRLAAVRRHVWQCRHPSSGPSGGHADRGAFAVVTIAHRISGLAQ